MIESNELPSMEEVLDCIKIAIDMEIMPIGFSTQASSTLVCESMRQNGFVLGPGNEIYKCPLAIYNNHNQSNVNTSLIGEIKSNGDIYIDDTINNEWIEGERLLGEKCKKCKYYPVCHGKTTCPFGIKFSMRTVKCTEKKYNGYVQAEMIANYNLGNVKIII
jgi:radical SAM protein with 4Fe4S-binding SPASM domain